MTRLTIGPTSSACPPATGANEDESVVKSTSDTTDDELLEDGVESGLTSLGISLQDLLDDDLESMAPSSGEDNRAQHEPWATFLRPPPRAPKRLEEFQYLLHSITEKVPPSHMETAGAILRMAIIFVELPVDATDTPFIEVRLSTDTRVPCDRALEGPGKSDRSSQAPVVIRDSYQAIVTGDNGRQMLRFIFLAYPLRVNEDGRFCLVYTVRGFEHSTEPLHGRCFTTRGHPEFLPSEFKIVSDLAAIGVIRPLQGRRRQEINSLPMMGRASTKTPLSTPALKAQLKSQLNGVGLGLFAVVGLHILFEALSAIVRKLELVLSHTEAELRWLDAPNAGHEGNESDKTDCT